MYTAEQIRFEQDKLNSNVNQIAKHITEEIYQKIHNDPKTKEFNLQHSLDKHVQTKLEELGFKVESYLGGVYRDAWWTKITWD